MKLYSLDRLDSFGAGAAGKRLTQKALINEETHDGLECNRYVALAYRPKPKRMEARKRERTRRKIVAEILLENGSGANH